MLNSLKSASSGEGIPPSQAQTSQDRSNPPSPDGLSGTYVPAGNLPVALRLLEDYLKTPMEHRQMTDLVAANNYMLEAIRYKVQIEKGKMMK